MIKRLVFLLAVSLAPAAYAQPTIVDLSNPMVAGISQNTVEIHSSFNGAQLLIFGARNIPGDMIIAVRGPVSKVVMRRKQRVAGMWMHVEQQKYLDLPLFYALASTKPLPQITSFNTLAALGIGQEPVIRASSDTITPRFDEALTQSFGKKRWWQVPFNRISYFNESLFQVRLDLPDSLPGGNYTAEVYLFDHGKLLAMQTIPLTVYKTGLEAELYTHAENDSLRYGIAAVLMALAGGWLGHRLFHRR
jgi:uncharacterized protein (TIGR02186 family)